MRNIRLQASTLTTKCDIPHWFLSGCWPTDWTSGRMVTWLPNFSEWIDRQIFSPWCCAINCRTVMLSPSSYRYIITRQNTGQYKRKQNDETGICWQLPCLVISIFFSTLAYTSSSSDSRIVRSVESIRIYRSSFSISLHKVSSVDSILSLFLFLD